MKQAQQEESDKIDTKRELDFYNVRENRLKVFKRDNYTYHYCGKQLTRFNATLDHLQPVSEGGDNSFDNLITTCLHCNSQRERRPVMDIMVEKGSQQKNAPDKNGAAIFCQVHS
jgi:CRISPR/Cas system Type II protein with McrA/HNH and RuvC-like nuclease domain